MSWKLKTIRYKNFQAYWQFQSLAKGVIPLMVLIRWGRGGVKPLLFYKKKKGQQQLSYNFN